MSGNDDKSIDNFGVNPEGKKSLGKPRRLCWHNIAVDRKGDTDCSNLAKGREQWRVYFNTVIVLRIP
jgi:hypothetical protein